MNRKVAIFIWLLVIAILVGGGAYLSFLRGKQQTQHKLYHIGILVRGNGYEPAIAGFKKQMAVLGYKEGVTIAYDVRFESDKKKLPGIVQEFIRDGVDLIHTYSTPATEVAFQETKSMTHPIPVVFGSMGDPLVIPTAIKSIEHPGGNVTGVASLATPLTAKRLEFLKEINPSIKRVAMPHTALEAGDLSVNKSVDIAKESAQKLGIELILYPVKDQADNAVVAKKILHANVDGVIVGGDSLVWGSIDLYIQQAIQEKIPFSVFSVTQVQQGGLLGIGPDYAVSGRQSADIANKILRGGNPGDIPIQVPEKLTFAINKDTAKKIGMVLTPAFLKKADMIIEEGK